MAKDVSRNLAQRAEDVARYLLPNGKRDGYEWRVGNINGKAGQSLGVHLTGDKAGVWCDFASGDRGDLIDLWAKTRNLSLAEAIKEAAHYLGLSLPHFEVHKPLNFVKPTKKIFGEIARSSPVMCYLIEERKLTIETIKAFKIAERDREIIFPYFRGGELIFIKYLKLDRIDNKKQMSVEANCEPCLFGWELIPEHARSVILCEGELDAMSLYQYGLPALSVPFGGGTGKKHQWLEYEFDRLAPYDEIYLGLDDDEEGQVATQELIERLGRHRCRVVKLPLKDANECLKANIPIDTINKCFAEAKSLDPVELKSAHQFVDEVVKEFYPPGGEHIGYRAPWDKTFGKILFRPDELSVWTGINGHGKSQFLGQIILEMIRQGARVCIASLELKPKRLLMRLTRQAGSLTTPSIEYIHAIHQWYEDKLWLFDLIGTAKSKRLLEVFLYARQRYGVDVFIIDSLMKLDIAEDDYKAQKAFIDQLCDLKNQHNCQIHIVVHPRKSLDESQPPGKLDNKGTGAITDLADNCFSIWRNKEKEHLSQRQAGGSVLTEKELEKLRSADCLWTCDKQRNGDWEGKLAFWFHSTSLQYLASSSHKPTQTVHYSRTNQVA